jgi:hypothetical protein
MEETYKTSEVGEVEGPAAASKKGRSLDNPSRDEMLIQERNFVNNLKGVGKMYQQAVIKSFSNTMQAQNALESNGKVSGDTMGPTPIIPIGKKHYEVIKQDREARMAKAREESARKALIAKRKHYGQSVRDNMNLKVATDESKRFTVPMRPDREMSEDGRESHGYGSRRLVARDESTSLIPVPKKHHQPNLPSVRNNVGGGDASSSNGGGEEHSSVHRAPEGSGDGKKKNTKNKYLVAAGNFYDDEEREVKYVAYNEESDTSNEDFERKRLSDMYVQVMRDKLRKL